MKEEDAGGHGHGEVPQVRVVDEAADLRASPAEDEDGGGEHDDAPGQQGGASRIAWGEFGRQEQYVD